MIELKVNKIAVPDAISFNYDEIKLELAETLQRYESMVYSADQMKAAKADKAALNKLRKALNDERIRREREYMAPFMDFKAKINELIALVDKPVLAIDTQVKAYEEQKKEEKRQQIFDLFNKMLFPDWLKLEQIFVPSWLNATCSMKSVEGDLKAMQETLCKELAALAEMPAFSFEAIEVYKQTLNLSAAINEGKRLADIQARKAEQERLKAEAEKAAEAEKQAQLAAAVGTMVEIASEAVAADDLEQQVENLQNERHDDLKQWISFRALLTVPQAIELRDFFKARGIEFTKI